ncbi:hypothetical protein ALC56_07263, partial [Trachymyrmex septentrionalis]
IVHMAKCHNVLPEHLKHIFFCPFLSFSLPFRSLVNEDVAYVVSASKRSGCGRKISWFRNEVLRKRESTRGMDGQEMLPLALVTRQVLYRCSPVQVFNVNCSYHPASKVVGTKWNVKQVRSRLGEGRRRWFPRSGDASAGGNILVLTAELVTCARGGRTGAIRDPVSVIIVANLPVIIIVVVVIIIDVHKDRGPNMKKKFDSIVTITQHILSKRQFGNVLRMEDTETFYRRPLEVYTVWVTQDVISHWSIDFAGGSLGALAARAADLSIPSAHNTAWRSLVAGSGCRWEWTFRRRSWFQWGDATTDWPAVDATATLSPSADRSVDSGRLCTPPV